MTHWFTVLRCIIFHSRYHFTSKWGTRCKLCEQREQRYQGDLG